MAKFIRRSVAAAAVVLVGALGASGPASAHGHDADHRDKPGVLLEADLIGSLTSDPPLFGVNPGGVDWTVSRSHVKVSTDGKVVARIRRLLIVGNPENPVGQISASLVCYGMVVDTVGPVEFNKAGNARVKDQFMVPDRCLAPAVLMNPFDRVGTYIAASGAAR
jgi:hypothetical protein